jgi:CRISPR/Cas system-associated exonuclease Cas4 (RecB family)
MSVNRSAAAVASGETKRNNYLVFAENVRPHVEAALASGKSTHTEIANYLNSRRVRTHLGRRWNLSSVRYLRDALEGSQR